MIIRSLTASFGKLNNDTISFHDGLNIISLPNESGKSTWCAFIKAMLYGIDTSERAKTGFIPEKQRYSPWSGAPMEGSMDLDVNGSELTITRTTRLKSAPMKEFTAAYRGTNKEIDELNSSNAGEMLTGVTKEVFLRSAFIGQGDAAVTGSAELEKRITALFSSGEENVSYSEADTRLKSWQRKRSYNHHGLIPETESAISEKKDQLSKMEETSSRISELEQELNECRGEISSIEEDVVRARKEQKEKLISAIGSARDEVRRLNNLQNEALADFNDKKDALRSSQLGVKKESDARSEAKEDISKLKEMSGNKSKKWSLILSLILFVLSIGAAAVYEQMFSHIAFMIGAAACCIAALVFLFVYMRQRKAYLNTMQATEEILKKYGARDIEEIEAVIDDHASMCKDIYDCSRKFKELSDEYETACENLSILEQKFISDEDDSSAAALSKHLDELRANEIRLASEIAGENGKIRMIGDPLVLSGEIDNLKENLKEYYFENDAIMMAIDALKDADNEMQMRFSPQLSRQAAKYMKEMTGGKYEEVLLNRDFTAKAKSADDVVAHESEYLSTGTADLLYLAVRLAICEMALPKGESCPLIIDDALVNLDDERNNQAIRLLKEIAKERQVILFTCRK